MPAYYLFSASIMPEHNRAQFCDFAIENCAGIISKFCYGYHVFREFIALEAYFWVACWLFSFFSRVWTFCFAKCQVEKCCVEENTSIFGLSKKIEKKLFFWCQHNAGTISVFFKKHNFWFFWEHSAGTIKYSPGNRRLRNIPDFQGIQIPPLVLTFFDCLFFFGTTATIPFPQNSIFLFLFFKQGKISRRGSERKRVYKLHDWRFFCVVVCELCDGQGSMDSLSLIIHLASPNPSQIFCFCFVFVSNAIYLCVFFLVILVFDK